MKKARKTTIYITAAIALSFVLFLLVPVPKFSTPYSTVMTAKDGTLLAASVASDEQWRFPPTNTYSDKYARCLLEFEDKYYFVHPGFNPIAFFEAFKTNRKAGTIVRGGSTITMQVVRMTRANKPRTYFEKLIDVILAVRLEIACSKDEILDMYAANAPFGGNVVGIDAAAWRYFHTTPDRLTWAEAATLATLPNSPALIHPGKSRDKLLKKRNDLLKQLTSSKVYLTKRHQLPLLDEEDCTLALMEDIPDKPSDLPMLAYHLFKEEEKKHKGEHIKTDINSSLQKKISDIMSRHHAENALNGIENSAVCVIDYIDNEIVAYIGNNLDAKDAAMVNMVSAPRSTGSVLKPFLFAAMLDEGTLLPDMILPDVPTNISGYTPKNYSGEYEGAISARRALQKSLNAPFVYLLKEYGPQRFHALLKKMEFTDIDESAEHYGLAIVLGGAELSLFDIVRAYAAMGRKVAAANNIKTSEAQTETPFSAEAVAATFNALTGLTRPTNQTGWSTFASARNIAWKTGTSFGFRDAWAVGVTDRYVVGVWAGNANREGRPGLTGIATAAPILFDIIPFLNSSYTYPSSTSESIEIEVCKQSGYPKSAFCKETVKISAPDVELKTGVCPYHKKIYLDETRQFRIDPDCEKADDNRSEVYFVLPPVMEWFYKSHSMDYCPTPPYLKKCGQSHTDDIMAFVYPKSDTHVSIPIGIKGDKQMVVFEIAHRNPQKKIFWNLDDIFLGKTEFIHQMPIDVGHGEHIIRCVDEDGVELKRKLVVSKNQ